MFFILSKILFFILSPGLWIAGLLLIAFIKRRKRYAGKLAIIAAVLFIVFSNQFLYKKVAYAWQINETNIQPDKSYTAILLGGIISFDRDVQPYFNYHSDRFIQTLKLYKQSKISKIIIAGGSGSLTRKYLDEASVLKKEFIINGVPDSVIITDSKSRNTSENAQIGKRIIDSLHLAPPYLLITSAAHMRRARAVFLHEGLHVDVFPTVFEVRNDALEMNDVIPQIYVLAGWQHIFKEMIGLAVYKITGKA